MRRRNLGGVWMVCPSPGSWMSESGMIAAMRMMQGTTHAQWELYLTQFAKGDVRRVPRDPDAVEFLCADYVEARGEGVRAGTSKVMIDALIERGTKPSPKELHDHA